MRYILDSVNLTHTLLSGYGVSHRRDYRANNRNTLLSGTNIKGNWSCGWSFFIKHFGKQLYALFKRERKLWTWSASKIPWNTFLGWVYWNSARILPDDKGEILNRCSDQKLTSVSPHAIQKIQETNDFESSLRQCYELMPTSRRSSA